MTIIPAIFAIAALVVFGISFKYPDKKGYLYIVAMCLAVSSMLCTKSKSHHAVTTAVNKFKSDLNKSKLILTSQSTVTGGLYCWNTTWANISTTVANPVISAWSTLCSVTLSAYPALTSSNVFTGAAPLTITLASAVTTISAISSIPAAVTAALVSAINTYWPFYLNLLMTDSSGKTTPFGIYTCTDFCSTGGAVYNSSTNVCSCPTSYQPSQVSMPVTSKDAAKSIQSTTMYITCSPVTYSSNTVQNSAAAFDAAGSNFSLDVYKQTPTYSGSCGTALGVTSCSNAASCNSAYNIQTASGGTHVECPPTDASKGIAWSTSANSYVPSSAYASLGCNASGQQCNQCISTITNSNPYTIPASSYWTGASAPSSGTNIYAGISGAPATYYYTVPYVTAPAGCA